VTGEERDSGLRRLQVASLAVCGILLLMVLFTMLFSLASKNSANAVKQGNDAATCRGQFSGRVTDARSNLDDARAQLVIQQFDAEVAGLVNRDPAALAAAVARGKAAEKVIGQRRVEARAANDRYQALLHAEVTDHVHFEAMCERGP
jgi:hypothetical protein